jgi:uncharacterized protein (TIGR02687 family)
MNENIVQSLRQLFEVDGKRIVFWYDRNGDLRDEFEALVLPGITTLEIQNNEFAIKYRILREEPKQNFLLYQAAPRPPDDDNWLLDVLLAHAEFRTDRVSIWLAELNLPPEYADVVAAHSEFFQSQRRLHDLGQIVTQDDAFDTLENPFLMKMLAVCTRAEPRLDTILESLLDELSQGQDDTISLLERCALDDFLWRRASMDYGYQSSQPRLEDFALELFKSCYAMGVGEPHQLNSRALVFFKRWKDNRQHTAAFRTLSEHYAETLNIEDDLHTRSLDTLVPLDYFRQIDTRIVLELVHQVKERTIDAQYCSEIVRERRRTFWYDDFSHRYRAVDAAAHFLTAVEQFSPSMVSATDAVKRYTREWHHIDRLYRRYGYHARVSAQATLLQALTERVEDFYTNRYLLPLNDTWQGYVDAMERWQVPAVESQTRFFFNYVEPFVSADRRMKIFVVISDALRYEIGHELAGRIRSEDRYDAELDALLATLPNYTQLGMAALLPHGQLVIEAGEFKKVVYLDDGQDTRGTVNRDKILQQVNGAAWQAEDIMDRSSHDLRDDFKPHDVIYIYHNEIDEAGDAHGSEGQTFEAVERTLETLVNLIKKLTNANANNIIVTADHGFLFQNREIVESDYSLATPDGDEIVVLDRRFVVGRGLHDNPSFKTFNASQLGLEGDFEIQIPKSINRLRQRGTGSRYVHGGASLQEVLIPVVQVNKKRTSDVRQVDVRIIQGTSQVISTGQLAVKLYQEEPVTDKVQARTLQIGLYTQDGQLISDTETITFDFTSENEREREKRVQLTLSREADDANGQQVYVRLMQQEAGTSHKREYDSAMYRLRRSFTSDF